MITSYSHLCSAIFGRLGTEAQHSARRSALRGGGLVHLAAIATLASAALTLIAPPAHAGHYAVTYAADGAAVLMPANSQMQTTYALTSSGFGVSVETSGSSASAKANSAITATFNWTADNASDTSLPPQEVLVAETSTVNASASVSPGSAGGSVDDGLGQSDTPTGPGPTSFQAGPTTLYQYSQSCTGTRYTVHTGSGFTVTCSPSAIANCGNSSVQVSVSYSATPTPIQITFSSPVIGSPGSYECLVGQDVIANLSITPDTPPYGNSGYNWTTENCRPFAYYHYDTSNGYVVNVDPSTYTSATPGICYSAAGTVTYTCKGSIHGQSFSVMQTLSVASPTPNFEAAIGYVGLGDPHDNTGRPDIALLPNVGSYNQGEYFSAYVTIQPDFFGEGAGSFFLVQLVNPPSRTLSNPGSHPLSLNDIPNVLDKYVPYANEGPESTNLTSSNPYTTGDNPNQVFNGYNQITVGDKWNTYLMFIPPGSGSQAVPLSVINWSWGGTLTDTGNTDFNGNEIYSLSGNTQKTDPSGASTTTFPIWSTNIANATFPP